MNEWTSNLAACSRDLCSIIPKLAYFWLSESIWTTNEWAAPVSNTRSQPSGFSIRCLKKEQKSSLSYLNLQRKFWSRSSVGCCLGYRWNLAFSCLVVSSASGFAMILSFSSYGWGVCFLFILFTSIMPEEILTFSDLQLSFYLPCQAIQKLRKQRTLFSVPFLCQNISVFSGRDQQGIQEETGR